ncbi:MAG: response regulator, partial [Armatimonadetes bacterium]|nr:response regulator [Armatimonadota bacterium]
GTTFYVVLPLAPPPPQERIQAIGDGSPARLPGRQSPYPPAAPPEDDRRPLVLVVEDERSLATQIARCLNEAGYAVAHAWNGLEALEIARELHPLAITLDIFLPGKDGWGVLKELKAEPETQGIPVVLLSLAGDPERAARWGAAACLSKPLAEDKLVRTVNELVEERRSQMMLVLVVDDAASDRQLLRDRLRGEGYTVISAPNGPDGIALALARRPDAMVLDLVMDGMSGYDVVEQLRSRPEAKDLPILICTAHDLTLEDRQRLGTAVQGIAKKGNLQRLVQDLATLTPKVRGPWNKGREVHA